MTAKAKANEYFIKLVRSGEDGASVETVLFIDAESGKKAWKSAEKKYGKDNILELVEIHRL